MAERITAPKIRSMKGERPIVCVTAYDWISASIADSSDVDLILVGDSVGNAVLGYESTICVTLDEMVHHTKAARRGVERALFVADMPFGSYQSSVAQCVDSAVALMKAGGEAVKLEGAYVDEVRALVKAGIPVMGHVGMTPQSVNMFGGHRVQGKGESGEKVIQDARALEDAGVFSIVLELIPADLAAQITQILTIPTIGIGAGPSCDGQIQVFNDIMGLAPQTFKHSRRYVEGRSAFCDGIRRYANDIREGRFPSPDNSF
jgi:3-methyl-2-oxobutanoate hydroxymethyltransferase